MSDVCSGTHKGVSVENFVVVVFSLSFPIIYFLIIFIFSYSGTRLREFHLRTLHRTRSAAGPTVFGVLVRQIGQTGAKEVDILIRFE